MPLVPNIWQFIAARESGTLSSTQTLGGFVADTGCQIRGHMQPRDNTGACIPSQFPRSRPPLRVSTQHGHMLLGTLWLRHSAFKQ